MTPFRERDSIPEEVAENLNKLSPSDAEVKTTRGRTVEIQRSIVWANGSADYEYTVHFIAGGYYRSQLRRVEHGTLGNRIRDAFNGRWL